MSKAMLLRPPYGLMTSIGTTLTIHIKAIFQCCIENHFRLSRTLLVVSSAVVGVPLVSMSKILSLPSYFTHKTQAFRIQLTHTEVFRRHFQVSTKTLEASLLSLHMFRATLHICRNIRSCEWLVLLKMTTFF